MRAALLALSLIATPACAEEVAVFSNGLRLAGTFSDGPVAAALILAGSGPTDRQGNSPGGLNTDSYRLLAEGLADHGVATIRADKRGIGGSSGNGNAVTLSDYAEDAGAWVSALKLRTGAECVWLVGHSEGGLIALYVAGQRQDLCGLVLLATPGRGFDVILLEQLGAAPVLAPHMEEIRSFVARLKAGDILEEADIPDALTPIFPKAVHDYMRELLSFDPVKAAQGVDLPVLVVQGARDLQVTPKDAEALDGALAMSAQHLFPEMTHMLKDAADMTQEANIATYTNPDLPLTPGLADKIADFVIATR